MARRQGHGKRVLGFAAIAAAAAAGMLLLSACASSDDRGDDPNEPRNITTFTSAIEGTRALSGEWEVIDFGEKAITELLPADYEGRKPSMTIKTDGTVGGFSGVNQFGSQLDSGALTQGRFALGPIAMTRMAGPPEFMGIESRLTMALSEPRRFSLRGNTLALMPAEGRADPLVRFRRVPGPMIAPSTAAPSEAR